MTELQKFVHEANECLEKATREETGDKETVVEIRTAKQVFTKYYGPILLKALLASEEPIHIVNYHG